MGLSAEPSFFTYQAQSTDFFSMFSSAADAVLRPKFYSLDSLQVFVHSSDLRNTCTMASVVEVFTDVTLRDTGIFPKLSLVAKSGSKSGLHGTSTATSTGEAFYVSVAALHGVLASWVSGSHPALTPRHRVIRLFRMRLRCAKISFPFPCPWKWAFSLCGEGVPTSGLRAKGVDEAVLWGGKSFL